MKNSNKNNRSHYPPSKFQNHHPVDLTVEDTSTGILSDGGFMKLEAKFIGYLNEKYLTGRGSDSQGATPVSQKLHISLFRPEKTQSMDLIPKPVLPEERKEAITGHKNPNSLKNEGDDQGKKKGKKTVKDLWVENSKDNAEVETVDETRKRNPREEEKAQGLLRSSTLSPSKSSLRKARFSEEFSPRKKFRVKFTKRDEVFKVENFKDELRKLKLMSDY